MNFPDNLRYTKEHEWIRLDEDGTAVIGITDFAQHELGDIVFVELEPEGTELEEDEVFGTVEAVKTVSELFMPINGTIVALNDHLEDAPESINESPYEEGWMIRVQIDDPSELDALMDAAAYADMVGA